MSTSDDPWGTTLVTSQQPTVKMLITVILDQQFCQVFNPLSTLFIKPRLP